MTSINHPPSGFFRSITVLCEEMDDTFCPDFTELNRWVEEHHQWYLDMTGVAKGQGFHLFYNREFSLLGLGLLNHISKINDSFKIARKYGFSVSITISANECLCDNQQTQKLESLLGDGNLNSLGLILDECEYPDGVLGLIEKLLTYNISIALIGGNEVMHALGIWDSHKVNGADMTWYPSLSFDNPVLDMPLNPSPTCFSHFRVFCDPFGNLYPCHAVIGKKVMCLGNIMEPHSNSLLEDTSALKNLGKLTEEGPEIVITRPELYTADSGIPAMCQIHLEDIEQRVAKLENTGNDH